MANGNGNGGINPNLPMLREDRDIELARERSLKSQRDLKSERELKPQRDLKSQREIETRRGFEDEPLIGSPTTKIARRKPDTIEGSFVTIQDEDDFPGIQAGSVISPEILSSLEEEIKRILKDGRINTVRGIKSKLGRDFEDITEEEVDAALTNLVVEGLVNEISSGRYQAVEIDEDIAATVSRTRRVGRGVRSFFGSGGRGRRFAEGSVIGGARVVGQAKRAGRFMGTKVPYIGEESRQRRAEEEAYWDRKFQDLGEDPDLPPSMRRGARKRFKEDFTQSSEAAREATAAGVNPYKLEPETVWNQKKQKFERTGKSTRVRKSGADIRQELLDLESKTQEKKGNIALFKFRRREAEQLSPGRVKRGVSAAGSVAGGLGAFTGKVASGGFEVAKQFGYAPRVSRTSGLTGYGSPLTRQGAGGERLRQSFSFGRQIGTGAENLRSATVGDNRLRKATTSSNILGSIRPQPVGRGRIERLNPFPNSRRISPTGTRMNPLGGLAGGPRGGAGQKRKVGRIKPLPLF